MFKKLLMLLVVLSLLFVSAPVLSDKEFSDISGHWAEKEIIYIANLGHINGYSDGKFLPQDKISRAEFSTIINKVKEYNNPVDAEEIIDLNPDKWYAYDIRLAVGAGYLSGYSDLTVKPERSITREEAMTVFYRVFSIDENDVVELPFTDAGKIQDWAREAVSKMYKKGYVNGYEDGSFMPKGLISRAEVVKILCNLLLNNE